MAGANYMGGKRNFAKTRAKDSVRRIQKDFFGRRRLEMLSKGLANKDVGPLPPLATAKPGLEGSHIDLAHAVRLGSELSKERSALCGSHATPGSPYRPSTPNAKVVKGNENARPELSSGTSRSSRVLEALDTEPMFIRATLNRILALPDLACLSGRPSSIKRPVAEALKEAEPERKRQKRLQSSDFRSGGVFESRGNQDYGYTHSVSQIPDTAYSPSCFAFDTSSEEIMKNSAAATPTNLDSRHLLQWKNLPSRLSSLPPSSEQVSSDHHLPDARDCSPSLLEPFSEDKDAYRYQTSPSQVPALPSNNLYEHKNPWHSIGVILGLSPRRPNEELPMHTWPLYLATHEQDQPRTPSPSKHWKQSLRVEDMNQVLSYVPSRISSAFRTPSPYNGFTEMQSPFRILLESKKCISSTPQFDAPKSECTQVKCDDTQLYKPPSSISQLSPVASECFHTPSPLEDLETVQSPFRLLLAAKKLSPTLNLTEYDDSDEKRSSSTSSSNTRVRISDALQSAACVKSSLVSSALALNLGVSANENDDGERLAPGFLESSRSFSMPSGPTNGNAVHAQSADDNTTKGVKISSSSIRNTMKDQHPKLPPPVDLRLKEVDGLFQGPCLFPEDDFDESESDE